MNKLMTAAAPPPSTLPPTSSAPPYPTDNNAQRTSARSGVSGYAEAGVTSSGDSVFVGAAALKGRDPKTGAEVEVYSASAQAGAQNEAQIAMARAGVSGKYGSGSGEVFTLRANIGIHNDDGSTGLNAGVGATIVGGGGTITNGADSLTVGVSGGPSAGFSVGARDQDGDGESEWCASVSAGFVTVGACWEGT